MSTKSLAMLAAVLGARLFIRGELLIPFGLGQRVAPKPKSLVSNNKTGLRVLR